MLDTRNRSAAALAESDTDDFADSPSGSEQHAKKVERVIVINCAIDNLTLSESVARVESLVLSGKPHQQVSVNVDKVVKAAKDPQLLRVINQSSLVNVDGMPVVWASRLLGKPLKERVAGIDLFDALMQHAAKKGWRVFLLGAEDASLEGTRRHYETISPGFKVAGMRNGFWKPEEEGDVVEQIRAVRPHLLFVAIPSPRKELFLDRHQDVMRIPFAMGVGGSFDVMAGKVKRAPHWMQRSGLEWFFRFLQEPRRMFKRYFIDDLSFARLLLNELTTRNAARAASYRTGRDA
jgi:N-acetylglucosaminyldiphosphoundecaprenol N-acetyl-beta-D-mannosaminyltransferase